MKKIINFIVEKRIYVISFFVLLTTFFVFLIPKTNINYDMNYYLSDDSNTKITYALMCEEFSSYGTVQVMIENIDKEKAMNYKHDLEEIEGVSVVIFDSNDEGNYHDGYAKYTIFFEYSNFDKHTRKSVDEIKELLSDEVIYLNGGAIESIFLGDAVLQDMVNILLVACLIVFIILLINSISWVEPLVFTICVAISILLNLGTNALLPNISFMTNSICAIMQLALAMDYSIILLHRFVDIKTDNENMSSIEAVKLALHATIRPILGSSLTTVVGLLALISMKLKLGLDIGFVLAKGIVISLIVVFTFMPGILVVFSKLIMKTKHNNLFQAIKSKYPVFEDKLVSFQKRSRYIVGSLLLVLIVVGFIFYTKTTYTYTLEASNDPNSTISMDIAKIEEQFKPQNSVAILIDKSDSKTEQEITNYLLNYTYNDLPVFSSVQGIYALGLDEYYTSIELSDKYNIPQQLVAGVYDKMNENNVDNPRYKITEVIDYIIESDYIDEYIVQYEDLIKSLKDYLPIIDTTCNGKTLVEMVKVFNPNLTIFNEDNANSLIVYVSNKLSKANITYGELLSYISNNKLFTSIISDYKKYVITSTVIKENTMFTKANAITVLGLEESIASMIFESNPTLDINVIINKVIENNINVEGLEINNYINCFNTMDDVYTLTDVVKTMDYNYSILPFELYSILFGSKTQLTNLEIQSKIISNEIVSTLIIEIEEKLDELNKLLDIKNSKLTASDVSSLLGIDESYIIDIYNDLDKETLTANELVDYIINNNYLKTIGEKTKKFIIENNETLKYALKNFKSDNYLRIVCNMNYARSSDVGLYLTRTITNELTNNYSDVHVVSECSPFVEFEDTFKEDSMRINIISFVSILIIIAISFKSLIIPLILTVIIQGAIWLTMALNTRTNTSSYFVCYLMVVCIQMGTTIDYGILYTSNYIEARKTKTIKESLKIAFNQSIATIVTSGTILVVAAFVVGAISQVSIISGIGYLLSRGSLISVMFVLLSLPQVLVIFDKLITKKNNNDVKEELKA